jgi:hypothetical protein
MAEPSPRQRSWHQLEILKFIGFLLQSNLFHFQEGHWRVKGAFPAEPDAIKGISKDQFSLTG